MSMPHDISLILTLTGGLGAALVLGFVTQKLRLSPLVGYLLAGILVGPHSPGFVADAGLASQLAEIGIILLMFGVGLHFHLKDLLAVRGIALGGAAVQITLTTLSCMFLLQFWGFSLWAGAVFGMSVSVASTVVLTRVLADNHVLHTPTGHVALGWLVVEDLFTILLLVLLPVVLGAGEGNIWWILGKTLLKLGALTVFTLVAGQRLIPALLGYVARTGTRDLFTLAVIVLALGIAVGSALFFDASMAFGAFLAGMVVGQSDFSARATAEALPLRDAFAVLFFVSVGMLFDPAALLEQWPLFLLALGVIVLLKPLLAFLVCLAARKPLRLAEQYLIRAEAYCRQANPRVDLAQKDLEALRATRFQSGGVINLTGNWETDVKTFSEERVRELYMEGFRLQDLKRWGLGFERTPQSCTQDEGNNLRIEAGDPLFVWPIPQHELESPGSEITPNESNK